MANECRRRCGWTRPGSSPAFSASRAQDQEGAGAGERAALRVQEQLRAVAPVEVRPAAREVAAERLGGGASDRDDPFLVALADAAHDPLVQVDAGALEPDRLADPQPGAVEQLDERGVAQRARGRAGGGLDQPLGLARGERAGKLALRRGGSISAAGLSARAPSSTWWAKKERRGRQRAARSSRARDPSARSSAR